MGNKIKLLFWKKAFHKVTLSGIINFLILKRDQKTQ